MGLVTKDTAGTLLLYKFTLIILNKITLIIEQNTPWINLLNTYVLIETLYLYMKEFTWKIIEIPLNPIKNDIIEILVSIFISDWEINEHPLVISTTPNNKLFIIVLLMFDNVEIILTNKFTILLFLIIDIITENKITKPPIDRVFVIEESILLLITEPKSLVPGR